MKNKTVVLALIIANFLLINLTDNNQVNSEISYSIEEGIDQTIPFEDDLPGYPGDTF